MRLYIVRHAIAVPHGTPGMKEEDRILTEEGILKMRESARGLRALGYIPDIIWSSPLVRARHTAEILLDVFGGGIKLEITRSLAPGASRKELYALIRRHDKLESCMIVGHQPSLGEIAGEVAWGSSDVFVDFKKGGACVIDMKSIRGIPQGSLIALMTPSVLRKVAF